MAESCSRPHNRLHSRGPPTPIRPGPSHKTNLANSIVTDLAHVSLAQVMRIQCLSLASNVHSLGPSLSGLHLYFPTETGCGLISELHKCLLEEPIPRALQKA